MDWTFLPKKALAAKKRPLVPRIREGDSGKRAPSRTPFVFPDAPLCLPATLLYVFLAYAGIHESSSLTDLRFVKKVDSRFHGNDKKRARE